MMPEDETQMTPLRAKAACQGSPSNSPKRKPGTAFKRKSTKPELRCRWRLCISSVAENSSPSRSSKRMTPISAPASRKGPAAFTGSNRPSPKSSPDSR